MSDRTSVAVVSFLVIVGYLAFGLLLLTGFIKPNVSGDVALTLTGGVFGVLTAGFCWALGYWLGSSAGSRSKDALIAGQLPGPATPVPGPPISVPSPKPQSPSPPPKPIPEPAPKTAQPPAGNVMTFTGKMSTFGGPDDHGVAADEGLALCEPGEEGKFQVVGGQNLFLAEQPSGTTGLARRLNPNAPYLACRWDYKRTPRSWLQMTLARVTSVSGQSIFAQPIDWGPNANTGRVADLSPGLAVALGLKTDDLVTVAIPLPFSLQISDPNLGSQNGSEPLWLTLARAEIGFHELPDNRGIQKYVDLAGFGAEGEPWCAIFAGAMLRKAGVDIRGVNAMARSFSTAPSFAKIEAPRMGAIAVFWRGSRDGDQGHVGFYVGEDATHVQTLGGNENDQVEIEPIPKSGSSMGLLGYYWPSSVSPGPKLS